MLRTPTNRTDLTLGTGRSRSATAPLRLRWSIQEGCLRAAWQISGNSAPEKPLQARRTAA